MKFFINKNNSLTQRALSWKKDQAIISLTLDEMLKEAKGHKFICEDKIDGETALMQFKDGKAKFGTLGGRIISDIPVLDEIEKILKNFGFFEAILVGELAAFQNGKVLPFNKSQSIVKNPSSDKNLISWHPYQVLKLDDEEFSTTSFEVYMKTWPQLKKIFSGAKYVHPVEDSTEDIKALWDKLVIRGGSEGLVIRLDNGKTYKVKPLFTYDLVILAVGSKKGKSWPKKQIGMCLVAFMDKDKIFRVSGHIGTGWSREQSQELFKWAQANRTGEDSVYIWVRPQKVVECVWERSLIKDMPAYKFEKGKYESVGKKMSGTIQKPRFIRYRTDKSVNPNDLRLTQIPDWSEKQKMAHRVACQYLKEQLC